MFKLTLCTLYTHTRTIVFFNVGTKKEPPATFLELAVKSRSMFKNAEVTNGDEVKLKWKSANEEEVKKFLVDEKGFNEDRVNKALISLAEARKATQQKRIDSFFSFGATAKTKSKKTTKKKTKVVESSKKSFSGTKTKEAEIQNSSSTTTSTTTSKTTSTTTSPCNENDTTSENKRKKPSFSFAKKKTKKRKSTKKTKTATPSGKLYFSKR